MIILLIYTLVNPYKGYNSLLVYLYIYNSNPLYLISIILNYSQL